jgi:hypothetical protein
VPTRPDLRADQQAPMIKTAPEALFPRRTNHESQTRSRKTRSKQSSSPGFDAQAQLVTSTQRRIRHSYQAIAGNGTSDEMRSPS